MYGALALEITSSPNATVAAEAFENHRSENRSTLSVPFRNVSKGNNMGKSSSQNAGKLLSESDGNILAFTITQAEYQRRVTLAFREEVGFGPGAAKNLADKIECNDRTAKSWLDGKTTPHGILDRRAMARVPSYAALAREIAGMQENMDPRLQAKLHELHRLTLHLAGEP